MIKKFNVKFYENDGSDLKVLNTKLLSNEISFKTRINGGQGELVLDLRKDADLGFNGFDDFGDYSTALAEFNFVKVYEIDKNNKTGRLIYTGFISRINPFVNGEIEGVRVTCLGLSSMLALSLFKDGASFDPEYTVATDPEAIIKDIIDNFNSVYSGSWISYSGGHIDTVGTGVKVKFSKKKWRESIDESRIISGGGYFWRIDADGQIYFTTKSGIADHRFTLGKDIEKIEADRTTEEIINSVTVEWDAGTVSASDATSISNYGKRENYSTETAIKDATSAQQSADQTIADYKDVKIRAKITINSEYDFETIRVGDTCKVRGIDKDQTILGDNMQIVAITYSADECLLELEDYQDFATAVQNV